MFGLSRQADMVLDLTRSLQAAARAGEWPLVADLERQRFAALENLFAIPAQGGADVELLLHLARTVRALDDQTVELVVAERERAASELRKLRLGRQGGQAYLTAWDE